MTARGTAPLLALVARKLAQSQFKTAGISYTNKIR
jgi:hypothetical protein